MNGTSLLIALTGLLTVVYGWIKYHYSYWRRQNIPFIKSTPLVGSLGNVLLMNKSWGEQLRDFYNHPAVKNQPVVGIHIMHQPGLLIRDPELIKRIFVKDFSKFSNRYLKTDSHGDPLGDQNLFFIRNPKWKEVRAKLTPVFTSGKTKQMFPLITEIGDRLDTFISSKSIDNETNAIELDVKDVSVLFTNDVIATVAFGVDVDSFMNPKNEFLLSGKNIFASTPSRALHFFIILFVPQLVRIFGTRVFSKKTSEFLKDSIAYVLNDRAVKGQVRNDLIDILLGFKKEAELDSSKKNFATLDFMVAQAAVFFTAGFETSSSTISFAMYELSKAPEIQKKLREEIREALKETGGKITYEMARDMKFLNQVISETLRLYPSVPFLERECTLSDGEKSYSLGPHSSFEVPHGMPIFVSNLGIQRDPKYFPDPDKFDPERFSPENKAKLNAYANLPFGVGPHNCIGERLGLIQSRVGLISYLRNYFVTSGPKSLSNMEFEKKTATLQSKGGIYIYLVRDPLV